MNKMELIIIIKNARNGKITYEEAFNQMNELFDRIGCFNIDDIKLAFEIGRVNGRKRKHYMSADDIVNAFIEADRLSRNLKFE